MKQTKCMFCKKNIADHLDDIPVCSDHNCISKLKEKNINLFRKHNFLKTLHLNSNINSNKLKLNASRPWSSTGILNLYENIKNKWSNLKTAKETKRTIGDIKRMTKIIEKEGFEKVYFSLLKLETLKRKDVSEELLWLKENGILSNYPKR